ncbi:hypothetical protein EBQ81_05715, partial [bacterium]|nr:hypothetical protein [bacterium]
TMADKGVLQAVGVGIVRMQVKSGGEWRQVTLINVLHVPGLENHYFSIKAATSKGLSALFERDGCTLFKGKEAVFNGKVDGKLYVLEARHAYVLHGEETIKALYAEEDATLWHRRLGHLSPSTIKNMENKGMVEGLTALGKGSAPTAGCATCVEANLTQGSYGERPPEERSTERLELVHTDVCSMKPTAVGGYNHFVTFTDDFSRKSWLYPIKAKSEVFGVFTQWLQEVETGTGLKLKALRCDGGGEYVSGEFKAFLLRRGIRQDISPPHTPQHNGVAERLNRTLNDKVRAMLLGANVRRLYWADAVLTACYLKNLSLSKTLGACVPEARWTGRTPHVGHLRVFGCLAYVRVKAHRGKLEPKARRCIFLGYEQGGRVYKLLECDTRKIVRAAAQDIRFMEDMIVAQGAKEGPSPTLDGATVEVEGEDHEARPVHHAAPTRGSTPPPQMPEGGNAADDAVSNNQGARGPLEEDVAHEGEVPQAVGVEEASLRRSARIAERNARAQGEDAPPSLTSQPPAQAPPPPEAPMEVADSEEGPINRGPRGVRRLEGFMELSERILMTLTGEPQSYMAAMVSPDKPRWVDAMTVEMGALERNKTFGAPMDLPKGMKALKVKWVYKIKFRADRSIERYKARLVAKGFLQEHGVDYTEIFAPVAKLSTVRLLFAIATHHDLEVDQMDITSAFLHGDIDNEIYIEQPEGYVVEGQEGKVLPLNKALYGLKQAPRLWNKKLDAHLKDLGFTACEADHALYVLKERGKVLLMVLVYVDDLLLAGPDRSLMEKVKGELALKFEMKDLGPVAYYLGIQISRDRANRITKLSQESYLAKVAERFFLEEAKPVAVPMATGAVLNKGMSPTTEDEAEHMGKVPYASAVGSIMYASLGTRVDVAYALSQVSRFSSNPGVGHWEAVKRVIRYLNGTKEWSLTFHGATGLDLVAYSDADFSSCVDTSKSNSGQVLLVGGTAVEWKSKRQPIVAQSTTEAEYVAMADATKSIMWFRELMEELGEKQVGPTVLHVDNMSAMALANDPVHHERTKHIRRRFHFIREAIQEGEVRLEYCPTEAMLADGLTKALPKARHQELTRAMGLRP